MTPGLTEPRERKSLASCDPTPSGLCYVYVLKQAATGKLYYGYTNNLDRRISQHRAERNYELVYYEAYKAEADARRREQQLKHYGQALTALKQRLNKSLQ